MDLKQPKTNNYNHISVFVKIDKKGRRRAGWGDFHIFDLSLTQRMVYLFLEEPVENWLEKTKQGTAYMEQLKT